MDYHIIKEIVNGRWTQNLLSLTKTDNLISMVRLLICTLIYFDNVKQFQFYQENEGEIDYYILLKKNSYKLMKILKG